jgi:hypothetical protein
MTARRVIIYLEDDLPDGTTEIVLRRGRASVTQPGAGTPEGVLARLKANGTNPGNIQAVYDELEALGLTPCLTTPRTASGPQPWINWRKDGGPVVCALDSGSLTFQRPADTPKVSDLSGVIRADGTIRFPIATIEQAGVAVAAVKRVI